jgi:hypothetical protein
MRERERRIEQKNLFFFSIQKPDTLFFLLLQNNMQQNANIFCDKK